MRDLAASPAAEADLPALLPLFAGYQRFYGAEPDDARNHAFFARFVAPSDAGVLLVVRAEDRAPLGFAVVYWTFSSVRARDAALMNDLFVTEPARGRGVGRVLIDAAARAARERGVRTLSWMTAPGNATARALYDATGATASEWIEYELAL